MKVFLKNNDMGYFETMFHQKTEIVMLILANNFLIFEGIKYKIVGSTINIPTFSSTDEGFEEPFVDIFVEVIE